MSNQQEIQEASKYKGANSRLKQEIYQAVQSKMNELNSQIKLVEFVSLLVVVLVERTQK